MKTPRVLVCAGGGGVGKTTSSTALAATLARAGRRTLIVTIDPARRLANALGITLGSDVQRVPTDLGAPLFALMPEATLGMRAFADILFAEEPEALERITHNRIYQALEDTVPGIQELVTMHIVSQAAGELDLDTIVVDTAPSRFALDFITYPGRLGRLLDGRAVTWFARMTSRTGPHKPGRVEKLLAHVMGPVITSVAELFADLALVRERFVLLNQHTSELLLGPSTRYLIVAAPTGASLDDACYLHDELRKLDVSPAGLILNRATSVDRPWLTLLRESPETPAELHEPLATLEAEQASRLATADTVAAELARRYPSLPQIRLPFFEARSPDALVRCLSEWLHPR